MSAPDPSPSDSAAAAAVRAARDPAGNPAWTALDRNVALGRADDPALTGPSVLTGRLETLDFAVLTERVAKLAGVLRASQFGPGDRVLIWLPDSVEAVIAVLACVRSGMPLAQIPGATSTAEVQALVLQLAPNLIFAPRGGQFGSLPSVVVRASEQDPTEADGFGEQDVDYRSWTRSTAVQPTEPVPLADEQSVELDAPVERGGSLSVPALLNRLAAGEHLSVGAGGAFAAGELH
ncbi:AMP-binding protein [Jatrophihabitans telluris]|uniref:AMP-binding protein n=1 Tax=Jatrophihabitans telluris TaxID=2038343 RepID=A0ABY4QXE0_9ACTN|nr:AMP-binding protein [Jatrophihabitans telluris]UQX87570.1 AMP-binding protein [Jatrophihabitans telluris]